MKTVHKSVLIWYSAAEMFALVTDVVSYPQFLPWCDKAAVVEDDAHGMTAKVGLYMAGLSQSPPLVQVSPEQQSLGLVHADVMPAQHRPSFEHARPAQHSLPV